MKTSRTPPDNGKESPPIVKWRPGRTSAAVRAFLERPPVDREIEDRARAVLDDIRRRGDEAVLEYAERFDGAALTSRRLRVPARSVRAAAKRVDADFRRAAREASARIRRYAEAGMHGDWSVPTPGGGELGERWEPLDRVGVYIPGGEAPLASTALMTVCLAKAAGVAEIVACTPPDEKGQINPYVLYALDLAGATEIYRLGGIQAIGAMAFGTATVPRVRMIAGPGGPYVTAAKRLVYGEVALDMVAGPSEIAVLADDSARPAEVAADLLSQAEHGTGSEKTLLATPSHELAAGVRRELRRQVGGLAHRRAAETVLERGTLLAVTPDLDAGAELCNQFAPEHMELMVRRPERWAKKITRAGALFVGRWTPESVGDFAAGPSHVLPTGGTAAFFSGLTVDDFRRRISVVRYSEQDLRDALPITDAFGRVETLDGHARSARSRFPRGEEER
ncbi:histidinol dehydrogenase [Kiritimatiella glycovorans]|uniref:Histidinol dehydrogenase n=1 Tax=Kiritimatiella glycovorans TaxID=1307763 RepID=A0A0G3EA65_9BACT|nr:histidinol dehydrogenase [Kiritimatiella glycovorans]AKJ63331.1 Histidinol dehydrogenase [Kiritimatiella glycovorans]